jgi:hypothetical protein
MCRYFDVMGIFFLHSGIWGWNLGSKQGQADKVGVEIDLLVEKLEVQSPLTTQWCNDLAPATKTPRGSSCLTWLNYYYYSYRAAQWYHYTIPLAPGPPAWKTQCHLPNQYPHAKASQQAHNDTTHTQRLQNLLQEGRPQGRCQIQNSRWSTHLVNPNVPVGSNPAQAVWTDWTEHTKEEETTWVLNTDGSKLPEMLNSPSRHFSCKLL